MFIFIMIIGVLGLLAWNAGMGKYFILLAIVAFIINEIDNYLKTKSYNDAIDEFTSLLNKKGEVEVKMNAQKKQADEAAKNLTSEYFAKKGQVPVRIDSETKAYIVNIEELLAVMDEYYQREMVKMSNDAFYDMFKDYMVEIKEDDKDVRKDDKRNTK